MQIVQLMKALGDETRIRMMNLIRKQPLCVCEIEWILEINQSNASRHLQRLKTAGLIEGDKKAQWVYYTVNQNLFEKYPFVKQIIEDELEKIPECKQDLTRLQTYKSSDLSCEQLKEKEANYESRKV